VTFETASSLSYQDTRSKSAKDDQRSASDSFASLVDSNTAADTANNRPAPALPDPPAPLARTNDASSSSAADNRPPRDDNRPSRNDDRSDSPSSANSRDRADDRRRADAGANTDAASKPSKSDSSKPSKKEPADKTGNASDTKAATDQGDSSKSAATVAVTAVAVTIPVPAVAATDVTVAPAATGNTAGAAAPLAIAAAALKAQQAASEAAVAPTDQTAAQTDASAQTDKAVAAAIAAATPAVAKTTLKTAAAAGKTEGAASTATETKSGKADTAATPAQGTDIGATAQHSATQGEPKRDDAVADSVKTDAAGANAPAHPHDRAAATAAQTAPSDLGQPTVNTAQQQQLPPPVTAAVPAAQLTATAATTDAVPLNGVAVEIAANVANGKSRFEIRLDPAELGRIDVRMDVDRHGQVTSHLTVEKPETLAMLRQDAPQLQRALEDAGLKTGDGGLQFSLRDQSSSGQNSGNESGRNGQRLIVSEDDTIPAVTAQRSYGRALGSNSGVDIRI
jgi:chemotaxis protein MotD